MTLRKRRTIFYSLILVFLFVGTALVLYSQGWRIDLRTFAAAKVGGIYIRSFPADATIRVDGKAIENKSGFFRAGTWINDLFPKTYEIELAAPGFRSIRTRLTVAPALVAELNHAVLLPEKGELVLPGPIQDFWFLKDDPVLQNPDGTLFFEAAALPGTRLLGRTTDGVFALTQGRSGTYYATNLKQATSSNLSATLRQAGLRSNPLAITVDPANDTLLVQTANGLSLFDLSEETLTLLASSTTDASALSRFWIGWSAFDNASNTSRIVLFDKIRGVRRELPRPLPGQTLKLAWGGDSRLGIVQSDGQAYVYTLGSGELLQIARDARDMLFSSGLERLAVLEHGSLEIFSLVDSDYWRFNLPDIGTIRTFAWYRDNLHLLLGPADAVRFLSLEDEGLLTYGVLAATNRYEYDPESNRLHYLKDGALYRMDLPK